MICFTDIREETPSLLYTSTLIEFREASDQSSVKHQIRSGEICPLLYTYTLIEFREASDQSSVKHKLRSGEICPLLYTSTLIEFREASDQVRYAPCFLYMTFVLSKPGRVRVTISQLGSSSGLITCGDGCHNKCSKVSGDKMLVTSPTMLAKYRETDLGKSSCPHEAQQSLHHRHPFTCF
ncbi:hypothetical protein RRG08_013297 [Elysia crispata]|uniref:Uncharacterized protein n=1 Tax=Elysia crispata TaxID=231223 RepID=A0AAE1E6A2_9GAST|nr:hypothetical protein RRG08_013297 [Elysia crispata]